MVNIDNCLDMVKAAAQAIEAAPEKGFINLDAVREALLKTGEILKDLSPKLRFSEQLIEDDRRGILAKLKVLKKAGAVALIDQAHTTLESGELDYELYRNLRDEIDREFDKIFGRKLQLSASENQAEAARKSAGPGRPEDFN